MATDLQDAKILQGLKALQVTRSFLQFLRYVRIQEPASPTQQTGGVEIPFELWPHLESFAKDLTTHQLITLLKARRVGATWTVGAYLDWLANYRPNTDALLLSKTEPDAVDFLERVKIVHDLLPSFLSVPIVKSNTLSLHLANGSRLTAMASTENAGRGHAYSVIAQDEADFHPYLDQNFMAVKPTLDTGGQLIMLSTVYKLKMLSVFKSLLRGAPGNGWHKIFIPYTARPGRDREWWKKERLAVPVTAGLDPDLYMEQEFPETEEEALAPSKARSYFDGDILREMLGSDAREPIDTALGGLVRIWKAPSSRGKYIAFGDVAWGEKGAYSCIPIVDYQTGEQVAEIYGRPDLAELAQITVNLCRSYHGAFIGIEANGEGVKVVNHMLDLGYESRMYHREPGPVTPTLHRLATPRKVAGWITTGTQGGAGGTRPLMLQEHAESIKNHDFVIRCRQCIDEHMSFIRNEKGRPEASEGAYADGVMAWSGLGQMRKYAHFVTQGRGARLQSAARGRERL